MFNVVFLSNAKCIKNYYILGFLKHVLLQTIVSKAMIQMNDSSHLYFILNPKENKNQPTQHIL